MRLMARQLLCMEDLQESGFTGLESKHRFYHEAGYTCARLKICICCWRAQGEVATCFRDLGKL